MSYTLPVMNKSLLLISAKCDEGGEARFMKKEVYITCEDSIILKGKRGIETGVWLVPIGSPENSHNFKRVVTKHGENIAVAVTEATPTKKELVRFLHDACFYPIESTWTKEIKNVKHAKFPALPASLVN